MANRKKSYRLTIASFFIILIFFHTSCSNDPPIEKLNLQTETRSQKAFKKYDSIESPDQNHNYFHLKANGTTYRAIYLTLKGKKRIKLETKLKGEINLYFNVKNLATERNPLNLEILKKSSKKNSLVFQLKNFYKSITVNKEISLENNEDLFLEFSGTGDILLTVPILQKKMKDQNKRFVFLICADTLRADHLGIHGYPKSITKNITDFSKDAVIFDHCYAQSSWTLPSHMSLFTGLDLFNHGVYNKKQKISPTVKMLIECIYKKYFNVSYNGSLFVSYKYGFYRGFDFYASQIQNWKNFLDPRGTHETAKEVFKRMVRFLKNVDSPRVFSFLHTYQVHSPYQLHPGLPFSDSLLIKNYPRLFSIPQKLGPAGGHQYIYRPLNPGLREKIINLYDSEIEFFDHWFGYFINKLKEMGFYHRSMIILFSDHGEEFFDHKGWGHGHSVYNELIRVPLIIKFPDQEFKGNRISTNAALIDVFPTIFDYMGIGYQTKVDGKSLLPFIKENKDNGRGDRKIFSILKYVNLRKGLRCLPQKLSIIYRNFKLIHNFKYTDELIGFYSNFPPPPYQDYELYNLEEDEGETKNLVSNAEFQEVFEKLKREIKQVIKAIHKSRKKGIVFELPKEDMQNLKTLGYL